MLARLHLALGDAMAAQESILRAEVTFEALANAGGSETPVLHDLVEARLLRSTILARARRRTEAVAVLEATLPLAERDAEARPDDARSGPALASVHLALAGQLMELGLLAGSGASLAAAASIQAGALERRPDNEELLEGMTARMSSSMAADLASAAGRPSDAEGALRSALARCEWARRTPTDSSSFGLRAGLVHALGSHLMGMGRLEEAEVLLREAASERARRAVEFPRTPEFLDAAADSGAALASALDRLGRTPEARTALADAIARYDRFVSDFGGVVALRETTATSWRELGNLLNGSGRASEARAAFDKSVALYRALVARNRRTCPWRRGSRRPSGRWGPWTALRTRT